MAYMAVWPVAATSASVDGIVTPDAVHPDTAMNNVVTPSLSLPIQVRGTFELVKEKLPPPVDVVTGTPCQ